MTHRSPVKKRSGKASLRRALRLPKLERKHTHVLVRECDAMLAEIIKRKAESVATPRNVTETVMLHAARIALDSMK